MLSLSVHTLQVAGMLSLSAHPLQVAGMLSLSADTLQVAANAFLISPYVFGISHLPI
jgi:hypothetical protein